jgi:hypothetical protein
MRRESVVSVWFCAPFQFSKPCRERCAARFARCDARRPRSGETASAPRVLRGVSLSLGPKSGVPSSAKLTRPWSNAASQRAERRRPLWTSRRCSSLPVRPGDDVGGAQQGRIGDASQRAPATPVVQQGGAEHVLADSLDHPAFGLGGSRKVCGLGLESVERRLGQAHRQLVDAIERFMQLLDRGEHEGRHARAGKHRRGRRCAESPIDFQMRRKLLISRVHQTSETSRHYAHGQGHWD